MGERTSRGYGYKDRVMGERLWVKGPAEVMGTRTGLWVKGPAEVMGTRTGLWVKGPAGAMGTRTGLWVKGPAEVYGYKDRVMGERTSRGVWVQGQGYG